MPREKVGLRGAQLAGALALAGLPGLMLVVAQERQEFKLEAEMIGRQRFLAERKARLGVAALDRRGDLARRGISPMQALVGRSGAIIVTQPAKQARVVDRELLDSRAVLGHHRAKRRDLERPQARHESLIRAGGEQLGQGPIERAAAPGRLGRLKNLLHFFSPY